MWTGNSFRGAAKDYLHLPVFLKRADEGDARAIDLKADLFTQLAAEGLKREIGRRSLEKLKREAADRRGTMTDEEVDETVARAVSDYRAERHHR